jgi:hypothetical protein
MEVGESVSPAQILNESERNFMTLSILRKSIAVGMMTAGIGAVLIAQPPAKEPTVMAPNTPDYGVRPVAFIHGDVRITRSELAEFLIARGGYEKVELLVNKKIIEMEAARRGITVTPQEMEAALLDDIKGLEIKKEQFIEVVLSKYGKSYFEWMEDVVRPRLLLTKMCKESVTVTDDDLKLEFERQFGEKRQVQLIIWPKGETLKTVTRIWNEIRNNAEEFDRAAKQQANPALASTGGKVTPISRHLVADDSVIEHKAFSLREGEVSEIFETAQGYVVMKCHKHIPPNTTVKLEDEKEKLRKAMFEIKLSQRIPKYFEELKKAASPNVLLSGPPTEWQYRKAVKEAVEDLKQTGGSVPAEKK